MADFFSLARDQTSDPERLQPDAVRGSSEAPEHPARAAFDGFNNRYWTPAEPGPAGDEYLEVEFAEPVRLHQLLISPGSSVNQDEFLALARPAAMTVELVDADGERSTETLTLRDEPGAQSFPVRGTDVVRARLTVVDAFGAAPDRALAVAEVEFFGHR